MICAPVTKIPQAAAEIVLKNQRHEQGLHQGPDLQGQDQDQGLPFLAERCNFIAMSGYCHDMLSVCRL